MRGFGTRRALWNRRGGAVASVTRLPAVGPFSDLTPVDVSSLPDVTYASGVHSISTSRASPLKANNITLSAGATLTHSGTYYTWIWCNIFNWAGDIQAVGSNGDDASLCCGNQAGAGGNGASGGGGGAASTCGSGGIGGSGNNGTTGYSDCSGSPGGGGLGTGLAEIAGNPYPLVYGGDGGPVGCCGNNGLGGPGYGGGGGGAGFAPAAGGGAAGAGGIIVVARQILGVVPGRALAYGGDGGTGSGQTGGGGGGGSINLFAIKYTTLAQLNIAGGSGGGCGNNAPDGNFQCVEINQAGTALGTVHLNTNVAWNNL